MSNSPGYFGTGWGSTGATSSGGQPGWENIYNPRLDWGPCYYDQTHIFTSYVTYQLPFGRGKQFGHDMNPALNAVLGNWEIGGIVTLHSGNALTLNNFGGWGVAGNSDNTNGIDPERWPDCRTATVQSDVSINKPYTASSGQPGYIQWIPNSITGPVQSGGAEHIWNLRCGQRSWSGLRQRGSEPAQRHHFSEKPGSWNSGSKRSTPLTTRSGISPVDLMVDRSIRARGRSSTVCPQPPTQTSVGSPGLKEQGNYNSL